MHLSSRAVSFGPKISAAPLTSSLRWSGNVAREAGVVGGDLFRPVVLLTDGDLAIRRKRAPPKRKFLVSPGDYRATIDGPSERSARLGFWGE